MYLEDVRQACERILSFTAGKTLHDPEADPLLSAAVERIAQLSAARVPQVLERRCHNC